MVVCVTLLNVGLCVKKTGLQTGQIQLIEDLGHYAACSLLDKVFGADELKQLLVDV